MTRPLLTAYYFMGQDLCIVPRHVREDLAWMRDYGTDAIAVPIHEYQLDKDGSLEVIRREAERAGLQTHIIVSRWGGLVAGWPTTAGSFSATTPEAWALGADGAPLYKGFCGGMLCSIFHPATRDFFLEAIDRLCANWDFAGVVWDELKSLHETDHNPAALEACGGPPSREQTLAAVVDFFGQVNDRLRGHRPDTVVSTFIYADQFDDPTLDAIAGIRGQDYFGCDGKCWPVAAKREGESTKTLIDQLPRFQAAAAKHGVGSLALIETQGLDDEQLERSIKYLPEFLELGVDHVMYYYFGAAPMASFEATHASMENAGKLLKAWRESAG